MPIEFAMTMILFKTMEPKVTLGAAVTENLLSMDTTTLAALAPILLPQLLVLATLAPCFLTLVFSEDMLQ